MVTPNTKDSGKGRAGASSLLTRMREATGTVYGDIGTSVLYTVMEMTRETIRLKHHVHDEEQLEVDDREWRRPDHPRRRRSAASASSSGRSSS